MGFVLTDKTISEPLRDSFHTHGHAKKAAFVPIYSNNFPCVNLLCQPATIGFAPYPPIKRDSDAISLPDLSVSTGIIKVSPVNVLPSMPSLNR